MPGDTVIFSSNPIPGNEKSVSRVINELSAKGANVIFSDAHVSGHACQEELKLIYSLVKPKYAIPVHGEYRHLKANAGVAMTLGIPKENVFILHSGDVLELNAQEAKVVDKVHTGEILVDGLGVGDVGNIVVFVSIFDIVIRYLINYIHILIRTLHVVLFPHHHLHRTGIGT